MDSRDGEARILFAAQRRIPTAAPTARVLPAEAALDAEVALRDSGVERRGHLDDRVVLHVQGERAADAAVGADRGRLRLAALVPLAGAAQVELRLENERAGRAHADAVAAEDAGGIRQRHVELGRDSRLEAASGDRDGEGVLRVRAAGLDALVAEHA